MGPPPGRSAATDPPSASVPPDSTRIEDQEARSREWQTTGAESKRAFPRIPCRLLVDYVVDGRAYRDCIANISEGGAFIETSRPVEAGRPIMVSFALFQDQQPVKVAGEVAWAGATGMGVRFNQPAAIGDIPVQEEPAASPSREVEPPRMSPCSVSEPRETDLPPRRRYAERTAALPIWVGLVAVAVLVLVVRFDMNTRIVGLEEKADRSLQAWVRVEAAISSRLAQASAANAARTHSEPAAPASAPPSPAPIETPAPADRSRAAPQPAAPARDREPTGEAAPETIYVVQRGDNLFRIGQRFNVSPQTLMAHNNLARADVVSVGQRIRIPSVESR